jgi:predicted phosphodiesterase
MEAIRYGILRRRERSMNQRTSGKLKRPPNAAWLSDTPGHQWNPDKWIPPSDDEKWEPYLLSFDKDVRGLIFSDLHFPYHDIPAIKAMLEHGRRLQVDFLIINGDLFDFYKLSRFDKDPNARDVAGELDQVNQFLDGLDEMFPKARKIFKLGNHDERLPIYIQNHAPELAKVLRNVVTFEGLLELEERGNWELVDNQRLIYANELTILHGHEFPTPVIGPVNAARGLFIRAFDSAIAGHHHQISEHTAQTVRGKPITTYSIGCLTGLNPRYRRLNQWSHGFAVLEFGRKQGFRVDSKRIYKGRILN